MNDKEIALSRDAYSGFTSITMNESAFRLFNQAGDVARGMGHYNVDPIHVIAAALRDSNLYWRFVRDVAPVTFVDATRAASEHYQGPIIAEGAQPVITQFTPAMQEVAARLHNEHHEWVSAKLASRSGVETSSFGLAEMLLALSVESDSPAVKALQLHGSPSSV